MDNSKQPGIQFESIILTDLTFSRNPTILQKPELKIEFQSTISFSENKERLIYKLSCSVQDIHKSFNLTCSMVGIFSVIPESPNMDLEYFAKNNAPALMFPYIREIIATTTLKAGLASVLLPPLNIHAIINRKEPSYDVSE